jgi:hypothetical protein
MPAGESIWSARILKDAVKPAVRVLFQPQTLAQLPRLLTEGIGPVRRLFVQMHNQGEIQRFLQEGGRVDFISSFARSGNTWVRYLLADALLQSQGMATDTELPVHPRKLIPDYYCDLVSARQPVIKTPSVLVKTHDLYDQLRARFGLDSPSVQLSGSLGPCRILYLYRSPEDVMVSYYHLQRTARYIRQSSFGIDEFCRREIPNWLTSVQSYLRAEEEGVPVHFVSYEKLLREPDVALSGVLRWLEVPHDAAMVERCVSHMQFGKMRALEERSFALAKEFWFRRGDKGGGRAELQTHTLCRIREETDEVLKRIDKRMARQNARRHSPIVPPALDEAQFGSLNNRSCASEARPSGS